MDDIRMKNMQDVGAMANIFRVAFGPSVGPIASGLIKSLGALAIAETRDAEPLKGVIGDLSLTADEVRGKLKTLSRENPELDLSEIDVLSPPPTED